MDVLKKRLRFEDEINQQNAQINPELICAFCWFISSSSLKMHGPKNKICYDLLEISQLIAGAMSDEELWNFTEYSPP